MWDEITYPFGETIDGWKNNFTLHFIRYVFFIHAGIQVYPYYWKEPLSAFVKTMQPIWSRALIRSEYSPIEQSLRQEYQVFPVLSDIYEYCW